MLEVCSRRGGAVIAGEEAKPSGGPKPGSMSALLEELAEAPEVRPGTGIAPGTVIGGRFEVLRELGRGGFGVVFEARDRDLGRLVAVKVVRARRGVDPGMLRGEAEAAAALHHPNIVTVHDLGSAGGEGWLVLELLRGETLEARLHRGALPGPEALRVATEIARGLAHAHHAGVLHRDLKPSNVFLCDDGAVKILDFGLSRVFGSGSGPEGGTPAYMAPEQWRRDAEDERTDVFALGVMVHEMLTGNRPFAVESGRSTALDDGPVPEIPASAAPRNVRALVRRSMSRSRDDRPRDGAEVLESLLEQRTATEAVRIRKRVVLAGALVAAVAILALVASRALQVRDLAPGQRIPVAVADFQNGTSDPELNGLSGMLTTSLEQSKRLTVLTRSRLADLIRQTGKEVPDRIDESLAREVGKAAGVKALLLATVHRFDDVYAIEMRALDPATNDYLFTLKEDGKGKGSIPGMIDRLSSRAREQLRERPSDVAGGRGVADVTTANLAAYEHYFKGRQALDQARFDEARIELTAALKVDPQFALAHYQTAVLDAWTVKAGWSDDASLQGVQQHIDTAVRLAGRLPDKERLALLAWKATWEGRNDEALRLRDEAAERWPQDKEAVFWAGDIRFHTGDTPAAIPYFERALQLDPAYALAEEHTLMAYAALDRRDEYLALARRWADRTHEASAYRAVGRALLALDRRDDALEAYAKATEKDGLVAYPPMLAHYLAYQGGAHEAEARVRAAIAKLPPPAPGEDVASKDVVTAKGMTVAKERAGLHHTLVELLVYQGRLREARKVVQSMEAEGIGGRELATGALGFAFASCSPSDYRDAAKAVDGAGAEIRPQFLLDLALTRALSGDPAGAEAMAPAIFSGPYASEYPAYVRPLFDGIVAWKKGDLDVAADRLRIAPGIPYADPRFKALTVLGEVELARGRNEAAIAALEQARAIGFTPFVSSMATLRATGLYQLAVAYERIGDRARARERVDELLRLWQRADPDLPRLAEAKAMKKRLAPKTAQATQR
jgi:tetratricopeptide (TPR) repeat protein